MRSSARSPVGSLLSRIDHRRLVSIGFATFAVCLAAFALVRSAGPAFPIAFALGFAYFLTATALSTIFQQNLADTERAAVMPLWFMSFGGTVPIGNLVVGPVIDAIGARSVLLVGAAFAMFLAWWTDLHRLSAGAFLPEELGGEPFEPGNPARLHEHRIPADSSPSAATGSSTGGTPYRSVPMAITSMPSRSASAATWRAQPRRRRARPSGRGSPRGVGRQRGERLECGAHRVGIGVVGVVDDDRPDGARRTSIRIADTRAVASASAASTIGPSTLPRRRARQPR